MPSHYTNTNPAKRPSVPSAPELFATLMGSIEPDLLLSTDKRKAKYAGETSAEQQQRMQRYQAAFQLYRVKRDEALRELHIEANKYVHLLFAQAEALLSSHEQETLRHLENEISKHDA